MKSLFSYILILIAAVALLVSCADDTFTNSGLSKGESGLKLALNLPSNGKAGTRVGGTSAETGTEEGQDSESWIQATDIRLLIFQNDQFQEEITGLRITGTGVRFLEGKTSNGYTGTIKTVVLANLSNRGVAPTPEDFNGKNVTQVYELLNYTYGENSWTLDKDHRMPMWGSTTLTLQEGKESRGSINLYRALAKINVKVNEGKGLNNFTLHSVAVYYANKQGYCAPLDPTAEDAETQFNIPFVPVDGGQWVLPFEYKLEEGSFALENKIYIPESNNKLPGEGKKPLCLVVGGVYEGEGLVDEDEGKESYYRIDFKDDLEDKTKLNVYDVIRNHAYEFNIHSVKNPGTTTPEEALDNVVVGMEVTLIAWVNDPMRGIPDQYTLTTDKSRITFGQIASKETVEVWTDYEPDANSWDLDIVGLPSWLTVTKDDDDHVRIVTTENHGVARDAAFYVQAGNLKKQIVVYQNQPPTANCYVVGDGEHELIVTIKGNGNEGIYASSDKGLGIVKLVESDQNDAAINPDKIGIIWETKAGLVTLIDKNRETVTSGFAIHDKEKGSIKYKVNSTEATVGDIPGGNALIGAFAENGTLLWSWHIWVCPDMVETSGTIKEDYIEDWKINGYYVMDRNLGALDNKPGVASLGLLYQWGRKDPFIGASVTNDDYSDEGVLPTVTYHNYSWKVSNKQSNTPMTLPETIMAPTTLTKGGLSKGNDGREALLWGTDGGLSTTDVNLGSKTIYDPCPIGYRVPPVDAFVFETNKVAKTYTEKSEWIQDDMNSFKYNTYTPSSWETVNKSSSQWNWNENLIYIPHQESGYRSWNAEQHLSNYNGYYIVNASHYGFYLNYKEIKEPSLTTDFKKSANNGYYFYQPENRTNITWLPISGAYDPHIGNSLTFKGVTIEQGSSITVNSFLWTNSSVKSGNKTIPAAMFLHGTETANKASGRHIHGLNQTNIRAQPQYAGAVRCVRDVHKDFSKSNQIPSNVDLGKNANSTVTASLTSVNDTWRIVDAGAPWFKISPDRGVADKNKGQTITITALQANNTGSPRTATVLIQFSQESQPRSFTVTQSNR